MLLELLKVISLLWYSCIRCIIHFQGGGFQLLVGLLINGRECRTSHYLRVWSQFSSGDLSLSFHV